MINPPKKALIVDDQENWRDSLTSLLIERDYLVDTATNFDEAFAKLHKVVYDLLIFDVRLEDDQVYNVQGIELLKIAREKGLTTKIIIISGYQNSIRPGILDKFEANAFFTKSSFDTHQFLKLVVDIQKEE